MNLDVIAAVAFVAVLTSVLVLVWGLIRGHARGAWWAARVIAALVVSLVIVAAATYGLMNSRRLQLLGEHVSRVDMTRKLVALTFDDGPRSHDVSQVLADLARHRARATFYVTGAAAKADPGALKALVAAREELGNHTYDHRRLVFVSTSTVAFEVEATDRALRTAGYSGPITFRPPYAKKLLSAPYYLWRQGRTTVMWDLAPDSDTSLARDPRAMTRYVTDRIRPGSIVLLHPWGEERSATRAALPQILEALSARGYRFVTVSQLLALH